MTATKQKLPPGWTEQKIRDLIAYYEGQTEEESAAEIESAPEVAPPDLSGGTWVSVPKELVGVIGRLIKEYEQTTSHAQKGKPLTKEKEETQACRHESMIYGTDRNTQPEVMRCDTIDRLRRRMGF